MTTLFDRTLLEKMGLNMLRRKESLVVAESVRCGLLQSSLSNIRDASKFLQGGLTPYNLAEKYRYLHVEPLYAMEVNCVSQQVANQIALHITALLASEPLHNLDGGVLFHVRKNLMIHFATGTSIFLHDNYYFLKTGFALQI